MLTAYTARSSCLFAEWLSLTFKWKAKYFMVIIWNFRTTSVMWDWALLGAVTGWQCWCCSARLQCSRALFLLLVPRWIWPPQQKSLIAVLVSQFKLHGSKAVFSFPFHCLQGKEPCWWIGDSPTLNSWFVFVYSFFLLQHHLGRFFSKCIFDKPFHPVPSLCFPSFSPSQTDDRSEFLENGILL